MMDVALENYNNTHCTLPSNDSINYGNVPENISSHNKTDYYYQTAISFSTLLICVFGTVGNGIVIWVLGFQVKRTPFNTYILNLAIADFGVLVTGIFWILYDGFKLFDSFDIFSWANVFLAMATYGASLFLLTAISIDRCVAVFFPLWHQCHRPPRLSAIVCALVWVISLVITAVSLPLLISPTIESPIQKFFQLIVFAVLCLPLMTAATVALFVKAYFRSQQHQRGKLLTIVLLTLLFFLLFGFPFNVTQILLDYNYVAFYVNDCAIVLSFLNSSVNPVIYFLIGRQKKSKGMETMKMILQKAFKEEEEGCSVKTQADSQL